MGKLAKGNIVSLKCNEMKPPASAGGLSFYIISYAVYA